MPSVNSTVNRARSAARSTSMSSGPTWTSPRAPFPTSAPATRNSRDVESTVRAATPEIRSATSSANP